MCSCCHLNLAFDWLLFSRYQVHFKKYHIMIAYSRDYPDIVYDTVVVILRLSYQVHFKKYHIMIAYSRDYPDIVYDTVVVILRLSCLVRSLTSWVCPW